MADKNQQNSAVDPRVKELREGLQQDIVEIITKKLQSGEITEERAKSIAKMTLERLPENISYDDFMKIIPTLDKEFEEIKAAIFPIIIEHQEAMQEKARAKISELIKQGKYQEALKLTKRTIDFEKSLR